MEQTRLVSMIEATINIGSGFFLSLVIWQLVGPMFGYEVTWADNLGITSVFTVVSIARSYFWRRFFATGLHTATVRFVKGHHIGEVQDGEAVR